ncbi:hypothetical protein TIFTF001_032827 [Ficus carica]|uniref:Uncharacterized protein n=1 Tax=Ficus carica TaxID=3494 RepID=A0AA88J6C8_FICCA|nr:hypothetical protein TIFTF001_032827 [Ficus carica]
MTLIEKRTIRRWPRLITTDNAGIVRDFELLPATVLISTAMLSIDNGSGDSDSISNHEQ